MKYLVLILSVLLLASFGLGYWYYQDSQSTMKTLNENNAKLETAVDISEQTIKNLQQDYNSVQQQIDIVNQSNRTLKRQNNILVDKLRDSDIGFLAEQRPEIIERLINQGTENAFRCLELLSGAQLTERERNATNGREFNPECSWLFNSPRVP